MVYLQNPFKILVGQRLYTLEYPLEVLLDCLSVAYQLRHKLNNVLWQTISPRNSHELVESDVFIEVTLRSLQIFRDITLPNWMNWVFKKKAALKIALRILCSQRWLELMKHRWLPVVLKRVIVVC